MIDQGRLITEAVSVPVIGDADNGYGNCVNVKRTVKGFINAGFAGIILEDQVCFSRNIDCQCPPIDCICSACLEILAVRELCYILSCQHGISRETLMVYFIFNVLLHRI